ncbi:PEF-CTERM sorting domain-containing protein [Methanolobus sp.]|uniref:PEF-CTERM sorting domain-containing protein n=1 Tax=Methanolobus sp. TaxID=1874737 RepID=UPI0025D5805E|nr:PEF-CTERM sorting domain-containing protein [Methanolobus sp.]
MRRILVALLVLMVAMPLAMAASVAPVYFGNWQSGNAEDECQQAGGCGEFAYKFDDWGESIPSGEYDVGGGNTINISNSDLKDFDWESEYPVCAVIVVGGSSANVYYYDNATSDSGLIAPLNQGGQQADISHVTFCFNEDNGNGGIEEIPEFPTVALPIAAILGLAFFFQRRKE